MGINSKDFGPVSTYFDIDLTMELKIITILSYAKEFVGSTTEFQFFSKISIVCLNITSYQKLFKQRKMYI